MKYSRYQASFVVQSWSDGLFVYLWLRKASHKRSNSYLIDSSVCHSIVSSVHCLPDWFTLFMMSGVYRILHGQVCAYGICARVFDLYRRRV